MGIKKRVQTKQTRSHLEREQKYNMANIILLRHKSLSISRNDVFPSTQKRKRQFYSRHMMPPTPGSFCLD